MAARLEFLGRCDPCKRAVDRITRVGVLHRACDGARAQLVAVGNRRCGDCAVVRHGGDLVHRVDIDSQGDVLIVGGGDGNRDRADFFCQAAGLIHAQQ